MPREHDQRKVNERQENHRVENSLPIVLHLDPSSPVPSGTEFTTEHKVSLANVVLLENSHLQKKLALTASLSKP
jgi:hypothetical protein